MRKNLYKRLFALDYVESGSFSSPGRPAPFDLISTLSHIL